MHISSDAPPTGFDTDDALSREIAWNSFSHVGSYDKDSGAPVVIEDLLASEPRKVGITVPERMSVGNRVWRDADNSGTINPPDDSTPGIPNVLVNLYRDVNNDGIPDGPAISSTLTDTTATSSASRPATLAPDNRWRACAAAPARLQSPRMSHPPQIRSTAQTTVSTRLPPVRRF
jgi:hypothetical protein